MRRATAVVWLAIVLWTASAFAQQDDPAVYPITSFLDWTQNPIQSLQDSSGGQYAFEAGILGIVTRAADRYPAIFLGPHDQDSLTREAQATYDALLHNRPTLPYDHAGGDAGNPQLMPDWNHNGVFGDPGDFDADTDGDPHGATPQALDTAYFRYPCANPDGTFWYETTAGDCVPAGTPSAAFKIGVARELKVINSRGLVLDATLWLPGEALVAAACKSTACSGTTTPSLADIDASQRFPSVVFANGLSSRQDHYYWFSMRMAREGFVVLTYDPAGQGQSEGTWTDLFGVFDMHRACDQFSGACRDLMDMVRWFAGRAVPDERGALYVDGRIAPRLDPTTNPPNPALAMLDAGRVAIAGNSMGAISTLDYLQADGKDPEGNDLAPVVAAISLSGATPTKASVPIQFQTSDFDGSPLLVGPTVFGVDLGENGEGIGYNLIKQRYDALRDDASRTQPLELVVLEGGVHTDHVDAQVVSRTMWANSVASDYAADWLRCHAAGDSAACGPAILPREHLSRAFASEQVPAGTTESRCIRVPDRASLNQPPADFLSAYVNGKPVCDCFVDGAPACEVAPTFTP
jgi:hypothetical protein